MLKSKCLEWKLPVGQFYYWNILHQISCATCSSTVGNCWLDWSNGDHHKWPDRLLHQTHATHDFCCFNRFELLVWSKSGEEQKEIVRYYSIKIRVIFKLLLQEIRHLINRTECSAVRRGRWSRWYGAGRYKTFEASLPPIRCDLVVMFVFQGDHPQHLTHRAG